MRVKTDAKRQAILSAAAEIFREQGYARSSMAAISARVGGSKATLYSYFKSKEALFAAVMTDALEEQAQRMMALLAVDGQDLRTSLETFGTAYLDLLLSDEVLAFTRIGISEGDSGGLGQLLYEMGPAQGWKEVAEHLAQWAQEGGLVLKDPHLAALQFKGLLEAGTFEARLFGAQPTLAREDTVGSAVETFLCAYGRQTNR